MAHFGDDKQYGEYDAGHYAKHMEECLVEALDFHVQDSANKALVKALRPFAQPIFNNGFRRFGAGSGNPTPIEVNTNEPGRSSDDLLDQTVNSVLNDHEYEAFQPRSTPSVHTSQYSDSDSSNSDESPVPDKIQGKCKHKANHTEDSPSQPLGKHLQFDPDNIMHPRSTEWVPCQEVAEYVQTRLRKGFEKEVRNTLCSECPRPALSGKVADTPELDPHMVTFLKKYAKDPKKGIDRAWRSCQDKLLDISGPLTKILHLALQAKESQEGVDPKILSEWAQ
ncbi:hypothetical protein NDU88_003476 [Pleurodeles waltl]|uniref:Uncharacterized protein n=1 Tax=Pleurodeles waltl TaxID=8319 RepID=A0AAV7W550_PLEWA|nr:hypothetical protein NDU88_003476 [Pleurodeles waltl]